MRKRISENPEGKILSSCPRSSSLMTVVEVVPLVASAAPVVVGGGIVGAVVGILRLLVEGASLGVLNERLGVEVGSLLSVEDSAHCTAEIRSESDLCRRNKMDQCTLQMQDVKK